MFDQMKNLKQLASRLGNADQIKERMEQVQAERSRLAGKPAPSAAVQAPAPQAPPPPQFATVFAHPS